jgi:hypothetical protein
MKSVIDGIVDTYFKVWSSLDAQKTIGAGNQGT